MPAFSYKGVDNTHRIVTGVREAPDAQALARSLQSDGLVPLSIAETRERKATADVQKRAGLSQQDLTLLLSNLEMLLGAGMDLNAALGALSKSSQKKQVKFLVGTLRDEIQKGRSLAEGLSRVNAQVPQFVLNSIRAGESGGQLRLVLGKLAEHLSRFERFRSDLVSSLIYPAILLGMAALAIILLVVVVIPQFKPLFENAGAELPLMTRLVIGVSDFVLENVVLLLLAGAALIWLVRRLLKEPPIAVAIDRAKLRLPFGAGGLLTKIEAARFTRLMALLLENGIPMLGALELVRDASGNRSFARGITEVAGKVREGSRLTSALAAIEVLPAVYCDILEAGEEASQLETVLSRVAEIAERSTELALKNFLAVFVPVLTIALGGFVASIIASVMLALLSANELVLQ